MKSAATAQPPARRQPAPRELTAKTLVDLSVGGIGPYRMLSKLGDRGAEEIFLAEKHCSPGLTRRAVVKRVGRTSRGYLRERELLFKEASASAECAHPNVIAVIDAGEDANGAYIAFEHLEGTTLAELTADLAKKNRALPFELACFIVAEALSGVAAGAEHRVHPAITPAHLLISSTGTIKVRDIAAPEVPAPSLYTAPECLIGDIPSERANVYAFGVMLFELLTGQPWGTAPGEPSGDTWRALERVCVPAKLIELVARATNPCATGRFASAIDMYDAIEEQRAELGRPASPTILARTLADKKPAPALRELADEDSGESTADEPLELAVVPVHRARPPIYPALPKAKVVVRSARREGALILIGAALVALALFVAIVSYPA